MESSNDIESKQNSVDEEETTLKPESIVSNDQDKEKTESSEDGKNDASIDNTNVDNETLKDQNYKDNVEEYIDDSNNDKNKGKKRKLSVTREESTSEDSVNEQKNNTQPTETTSKVDEAQMPDLSSDLNLPPKQTLGKGKRARIPNKRYSDIVLSPQRRTTTKTQPIENGDKYNNNNNNNHKSDIEHDLEELAHANATTAAATTITTNPAKRQKVSIDVNNPNYRKPFEMGWKRELVYRGHTDNGRAPRISGDIYYYSPNGKKLRSMREINENIVNTGLTPENFTFIKEPLGINDPEKEIIRDAKSSHKRTLNKSNSRTSLSNTRSITNKGTSPKSGNFEESSSPRNRGRNLGNIKVKLPNKNKGDKKNKIDDENMEVEQKPPPPTPKRQSTRKATKTPNSLEMESKPCQPCSIRCQGVLGVVPTLHCRLCLCLYHYECVGLSPHIQVEGYVCKNCQMEHGQSVTPSPSINLPPLTPINTLKSLTTQSTVLPKLQRIPKSNESPHQLEIEQQTQSHHQQQQQQYGEENMPPPLSTSMKDYKINEGKSLVNSVTSWLPHSSTIQVDNMQRTKGNETIKTPRPQYVEYLAGRKFLIIPKHNVVSVSPTTGNKSQLQNMNDNFRNKIDSNVDITITPIPPPLPTTTTVVGVTTTTITATTITPSENRRDEGDEFEAQQQIRETSNRTKRRTTTKVNNTTTIDRIEGPKFMDNFLQNLSYGYNTLLYVFQYLKVQDLLRAGCVCTLWRDIASHPSLWKTVRMKNSPVYSFDGLANSLKKHGTKHLDLRKMLLPPNGGDDMWPEFSKAIEKVETLRKIELCRCPSSVIEQLAITNKDLEVINAVTIKCEIINLDKLSCLKNLKELRLKSTSGLTIQSDITALKELTDLKCLSLTSIKDLNKLDLSVIAALTNLESLDLGECNDFPKSFGEEILIKLTKLERLRLEKGQGNCHTFEILNAVKNMPKLEQLELVNFDIKTGFDVALGQCSNIKKLLIIPTYISQSATTNHMVLGGVLRLQNTLSHFVWGVTLELLRVTELFVDQCEDIEKRKEKKSGSGDSIPVLKPVPLINDKTDEIPPAHDPPQVEILPLPNLQKLLLLSLPTTRVKILKIPFHATWRQSITDTVN